MPFEVCTFILYLVGDRQVEYSCNGIIVLPQGLAGLCSKNVAEVLVTSEIN